MVSTILSSTHPTRWFFFFLIHQSGEQQPKRSVWKKHFFSHLQWGTLLMKAMSQFLLPHPPNSAHMDSHLLFYFAEPSFCAVCLSFRASGPKVRKRLLGTVPIMSWLPRYPFKQNALGDLISGISVGIMQLPQGEAENRSESEELLIFVESVNIYSLMFLIKCKCFICSEAILIVALDLSVQVWPTPCWRQSHPSLAFTPPSIRFSSTSSLAHPSTSPLVWTCFAALIKFIINYNQKKIIKINKYKS